MINFNCFVQNFKKLRYNHHLSAADLTNLLNLKSRSSITNIETSRAFPSFEILLKIANLFAVSIDWLVGRTGTPYNEELLLTLETNLIPLIMTLENHEIVILDKVNFPKEYLDPKFRSKFYSLPIRANIIFLLHYMQILASKTPEVLPIIHKRQNFFVRFKEKIENTFSAKKKRLPEDEYWYIMRCLYRLLFLSIEAKQLEKVNIKANIEISIPNPYANPLFDITKKPSE